MANLSRAGKAPGSLGLSGTAGLQLKAPAKKYGLQKARPTASAFGRLEDDGEEDESVGQAAMRVGEGLRARAAATHRAAEAEDASVFDYDGVYDEMSRAKERQREALAASRGMGGDGAARPGARYISSIMEAHKAREIENDKAFERKMVKEAEEEAHLYGDKERFVTSAYRRKLDARQEYEAELERKAAADAAADVARRGAGGAGLTHFHRNLLNGRDVAEM